MLMLYFDNFEKMDKYAETFNWKIKYYLQI